MFYVRKNNIGIVFIFVHITINALHFGSHNSVTISNSKEICKKNKIKTEQINILNLQFDNFLSFSIFA